MCGLFGWLKFNDELTEDNIRQAQRATSSLLHRGPDDDGEWYSTRVFMGHQRLKILDLSQKAAQPFHSNDGRYVLTYNGEIYNYIEIRNELQSEGVHFRTSSDTEVFLAAFITWGSEAFSKFEGMFAAAIHDTRNDTHYLVRDHLGQKPLYYYANEKNVVYASELRAFLEINYFNWKIDQDNFFRFLMNSYYIWDNTPLKDVKKLLPGCFLKIKENRVELIRYWDSIPGTQILDLGMDEAVDQINQLFDRACRICVRSDVPYGVLLSGGIDSSLALRTCLKSNSDVKAFSVAVEAEGYDESNKAREVCRYLTVKQHQVYSLNQEIIRKVFREFLDHLDEPHGDPGFVNMLFLAQSCRKEITVGISGDGGDELFAGYAPFAGLKYVPWVKQLPEWGISLASTLAKNVLKGADGYMSLQFKTLAFLQGFPSTNIMRYPLWLGTLPHKEIAKLSLFRSDEFFDPSGQPGTLFDCFANVMEDMEAKSLQQQLLYFYQKFFLPEFVSLHTDRSSMQSSLEVRSPFLMPSIIEFANRLPDKLKSEGNILKRLLKQVMADCGFPSQILNQKKQGFTFPLSGWLKIELRPWMEGLENNEALDGLVNPNGVKALIQEHFQGRRDNSRILFNLITFAAWRSNFTQIAI